MFRWQCIATALSLVQKKFTYKVYFYECMAAKENVCPCLIQEVGLYPGKTWEISWEKTWKITWETTWEITFFKTIKSCYSEKLVGQCNLLLLHFNQFKWLLRFFSCPVWVDPFALALFITGTKIKLFLEKMCGLIL